MMLEWIPCKDRLPEAEQEVLACTDRGVVLPAIYEDGTINENDSNWSWYDIDYIDWDEEEDCGIIPKSWWENCKYLPEGQYNTVICNKIVAWMPLPEPYNEVTE